MVHWSPSSTDPLRDALARQERTAARRLTQADSVKLGMQEETVTEMLLLALATSSQANRTVRAAAFTRSQEGRTGADWLWVFQGATGGRTYLLVQAKRLKRTRRTYATDQAAARSQMALGFATQREVLLARSRMTGVRAAYAFYNPIQVLPVAALRCVTWDGLLGPLGGVTMASAEAVDGLTNPTHLSEIAQVAWPLSCALLCWNHGQRARPDDTLDRVVARSLNASGITEPSADSPAGRSPLPEDLRYTDLSEIVDEITRIAGNQASDDQLDPDAQISQFLGRPDVQLKGVAILTEAVDVFGSGVTTR